MVRQAIERDRETRSRAAELAELRERYASLTAREEEVRQFVVRGSYRFALCITIMFSER